MTKTVLNLLRIWNNYSFTMRVSHGGTISSFVANRGKTKPRSQSVVLSFWPHTSCKNKLKFKNPHETINSHNCLSSRKRVGLFSIHTYKTIPSQQIKISPWICSQWIYGVIILHSPILYMHNLLNKTKCYFSNFIDPKNIAFNLHK